MCARSPESERVPRRERLQLSPRSWLARKAIEVVEIHETASGARRTRRWLADFQETVPDLLQALLLSLQLRLLPQIDGLLLLVDRLLLQLRPNECVVIGDRARIATQQIEIRAYCWSRGRVLPPPALSMHATWTD
jgi:hypothetical protein